MKSIKRQIRSFFGFSRAQTNGFIALLMIIAIALFSKPIYHTLISNHSVDFSKERNVLDSLTAQWKIEQAEVNVILADEEIAANLFKFNPNSATANELKALGFSDKLTKRLIKYRTKGGEFRIKSDIKKLYGMDSMFYRSLFPFIQLPEKILYEKKTFPTTELKRTVFDLNEADTIQLKSIYGVGSVLAKRIVKYRDGLGGFVSSNQLEEVYGLDTAVINRIIKASFLTEDFIPRKIDINTADEMTLSAHPYFSKKIARAIVTYRFQHGNYQSVDDLRKIETIDRKVVDKIYPYLTIE